MSTQSAAQGPELPLEKHSRTSFGTQAKALLRKNLQQQRRSVCTNCFIVITPIFFCILLAVLQGLINNVIDTPDNRCGCLCLSCCSTADNGTYSCRTTAAGDPCRSWETCEEADTTQCGFEYSDASQAAFCPIASPSVWPPMFSIASPGFLAHPWSPDAAVLVTGEDQALVERLQMFPDPNVTAENSAAAAGFAALGSATGAAYAGALSLLGVTLGAFKKFEFYTFFFEPAFIATDIYNGSLSLLASDAAAANTINAATLINSTISSVAAGTPVSVTVSPLGVTQVWKDNDTAINDQLFCGYKQARCNGTAEINGIASAYDWGATDPGTGAFSLRMWYNSTGRYNDGGGGGGAPPQIVRVHGPFNAAVNAFLRAATGAAPGAALARLVGIMEMPKPGTELTLDIASLVGTLFYTWLLQLLLPVMLSTLVAEKEGRLRTMMKMHGLGDAAYWAIQYVWYFVVNTVYVWILIGAGSAIGLSFFTATDYSFQFVFYFLWVACLVAFTFLMSALFRSTRTAVVVAFLYVFGTGLIGYLLLQNFIVADNWWVLFFNLIPGFALYAGLFEIAQYAFRAAYQGTEGMNWSKVSSDGNGLPAVMIFMAVEAVVYLLAAWYLEQVLPSGVGVPRHPLFFWGKKFKVDAPVHGAAGDVGLKDAGKVEKKRPWWKFWGKKEYEAVESAGGNPLPGLSSAPSGAGNGVTVAVEPEDVAAERSRVEALVMDPTAVGHASDGPADTPILIDGLRKVFPGRMKKVAVQDLALAVSRGEVFGLLGPNGAGKSTTINILTGFLTPSAGTARVQGRDIRTDMDDIYGIMGVCPQDNLLWERLTAREHLSFYGRLKGLAGRELDAAVEAGLRAVNLWNGGVADKQVRAFSGGMKRRLSVAISLIGDPQVVYMDEPSTGLDPSSRQNLWSVVKAAKAGRGIILTTHSMEEAAALCDRLGIFVDGQLVCIGAPKELTARYGGYLVLSITAASQGDEAAVDALVRRLAPSSARLTYAVAGTRRYEVSTSEVSLSAIFEGVEGAVGRGEVHLLDWGVANATLEEVFIKFAKSIGAEGGN